MTFCSEEWMARSEIPVPCDGMSKQRHYFTMTITAPRHCPARSSVTNIGKGNEGMAALVACKLPGSLKLEITLTSAKVTNLCCWHWWFIIIMLRENDYCASTLLFTSIWVTEWHSFINTLQFSPNEHESLPCSDRSQIGPLHITHDTYSLKHEVHSQPEG